MTPKGLVQGKIRYLGSLPSNDSRTGMNRLLAIVAATIFFAGCTCFQPPSGYDAGVDGLACVGSTPTELPGFHQQFSSLVPAESKGKTGQGKLCSGRAFVSDQEVMVYRLWDSMKNNRFSEWWTFEAPSGTRQDYRAKYSICEHWNSLDRILACTLPLGTLVIVGTTQSAVCESGPSFEKTSALQLYIPKARKEASTWSCRESDWPTVPGH